MGTGRVKKIFYLQGTCRGVALVLFVVMLATTGAAKGKIYTQQIFQIIITITMTPAQLITILPLMTSPQ